MNNVNFGMDGLSLDNTTWYNPKTGDSFKVRSNYFEDNRMMLQTYDGRRFDLDKISSYVKWTGSTPPPAQPLKKQQPKKDEIPQEVLNILEDNSLSSPGETFNSDLIDMEDLEMINGSSHASTGYMRVVCEAPKSEAQITTHANTITNYDIINRALSKCKLPTVKADIKWTKFPEREIGMLNEVMDVPLEDVSEYYIKQVTEDLDALVNDIKSQLTSYITDKLKGEEPKSKKTKTSKK